MFEVDKCYKDGFGNILKIDRIDNKLDYPLRCIIIDRVQCVPSGDNPCYQLNGQYFYDVKDKSYDLIAEPINIVKEVRIGDTIPANSVITENTLLITNDLANNKVNELLNIEVTHTEPKLPKVKKFTSACILQNIKNHLARVENKTELKAILAYLNTYYGEENGR